MIDQMCLLTEEEDARYSYIIRTEHGKDKRGLKRDWGQNP
jgi:hypothetical protein